MPRPRINAAAIQQLQQNAEEETPQVEEKEEVEEKYIPDSSMNEFDSKVRFSTAEWLKLIQNSTVTIIGVGGIGSWTALALARTSIGSIFCFDNDTVDSMNMAGQLYKVEDVGKRKVDAVKDIIKEYVPTIRGGFFAELYDHQRLTPITITALDSMSARETVWREYKKQFLSDLNNVPKNCLFVDGRMAAEAFQVFAIRPKTEDDIKKYEATLFQDSEAAVTECSYKATTAVGMGIGCFITSIIKEHIRIKDDTFFNANVQFFTEFDSTCGIKVNFQNEWHKS